MMEQRFTGRLRPLQAALAVALFASALLIAVPARAEEGAAAPGHARALTLVLKQMFGDDGGVTGEAERRTQAGKGSVRAWRVRSVEGSRDRFDVIFYIGDRPACVWRVELRAREVLPDGCSLELWEDLRA